MENKYTPLSFAEMSDAAKKRVELITKEFADGFEFLKNYPRSVTFFGSARTKPEEEYYKKAYSLAYKISEELHYSVVTGGGPGIMEAANKGAYEAGGNSIGITIDIQDEKIDGKYLTDRLSFHYFFTRKVCLSFSSEAYIFFPGGFGTLDEFSEILTLIHTNKVPRAPIVLFGKDYWISVEKLFRDTLLKNGMIDKDDFNLWTITEDESQIIDIIRRTPIRVWEPYKEISSLPQRTNHRNGNNGRAASTLAERHCVPCEGNTKPLDRIESETMLGEVSEWTLFEDKAIEKTYVFKDFSEALEFVRKVAQVAEAEGHHPDIKLFDYKKVQISITTHAIDGLSDNDFILAAKIDTILR